MVICVCAFYFIYILSLTTLHCGINFIDGKPSKKSYRENLSVTIKKFDSTNVYLQKNYKLNDYDVNKYILSSKIKNTRTNSYLSQVLEALWYKS